MATGTLSAPAPEGPSLTAWNRRSVRTGHCRTVHTPVYIWRCSCHPPADFSTLSPVWSKEVSQRLECSIYATPHLPGRYLTNRITQCASYTQLAAILPSLCWLFSHHHRARFNTAVHCHHHRARLNTAVWQNHSKHEQH
ncbi:hypothetical protein ACOMHN_031592 [Nucella lapillus]